MPETITKPVSLRRLVRLFWRMSGGLALLILVLGKVLDLVFDNLPGKQKKI